jgi:protein-export SecD/SecF family membrane protein
MLVLLITGALFIFPLNGEDCFPIGNSNYDFYWISKGIKLGLDLEGGMYAIYEADLSQFDNPAGKDAQNALEGTMGNLSTLLFSKGYTEASVTKQGTNSIRVEIPAVKDTEELIQLLGEPAKLEFKDPDGKVVITGTEHLEDAIATPYEGYYAISLTFNEAGTKAFADATTANVGKKIGIYVNGKKLIEPTVNTAITDGHAIITGNYTYEQANKLAVQLKAGAFEVLLTPKQTSTISPTLGQNALKMGVFAGALGLGIILIFLLIMYRGLGVAASLSLIIYTVLLMYLLAIVPWVQLTLPGIAGVILSIGMAVDANVIIFERIRDERRNNHKAIASSVKIGFRRSLSAIIDGNVTTILGAIIMLIFGATTIQSFAITLLIGILLSMFCALLITRLLINISLALNDTNDKYYGLTLLEVADEK